MYFKFQSPEENCELNRRIAVHIVTVCEKLFHHYIQKAQGKTNIDAKKSGVDMCSFKNDQACHI